jgi:bacillolysin
MKNVHCLMRLLSATMILLGINQISAQGIPTFLKTDNLFIQQRIERSDPAGWLFFKATSGLKEGELFSLHESAAGLSSNDSMHLVESTMDEYGFKHNRFQQHYKGIKVEGAEFFEHSKDCYVQLMHGKIMENLNLSIVPVYTEQQALNAAKTFLGASQYAWENTVWEQELKSDLEDSTATYFPTGELVLSRSFDAAMATANYRLSWKFEILALSPGLHKTIYVNANTGAIIKSFDMGDTNGPAVTLYDGTQTIDTKWFGGIFHGHHHLESDDNGKKIKTRNGNSFDAFGFPYPWSNLNHIFDSDDIWASDQSNNTSAHWGVNRAWDYFKTTFGRNGMNNSNNEVRIFAGSTRAGAFSINREGKEYLEFGTSAPLGGTSNFASLDVCGHEFTHGIVRNEANFDPAGEPGALNESFADIFGTLVEAFQRGGANWVMGQDVFAIRDLQNPAAFGHPATYLTDPAWVNTVGCTPTAANDRCGIHVNCGVQNRWFFLLTQGGTQNGVTVQGIGATKAAQITYSNLCNFLGVASDHPASRLGAIAAARQIFGPCSNEEIQTTNAWAAVGVGAVFTGPCTNITGPRNICVNPIIGVPTFTANGLPGLTYTWSVPPQWGVTTSGAGNKILKINSIPLYPSYPASFTLSVTASDGGTADIAVLIDDCHPGSPAFCAGIDDRGNHQLEKKVGSPGTSNIIVAPNPSKDWVSINSGLYPISKISIISLAGFLVNEIDVQNQMSHSIDMSMLPHGTYILKVCTTDGATEIKKIIKSK